METRLNNWEKCISEKHIFGENVLIEYDINDLSICIKNNVNNVCIFELYLFLESNEMIIVNVNSTFAGIRGKDILHTIHNAAKQLELDRIELLDTSTIHHGNIRLAYYHILLHGISWYNSFGYYGTNFKADSEFNLSRIRLPLSDVISKYERDITNLLEDVLGECYMAKMTVQQVIQELDWLIRRDCDDIRIYLIIEYFIRKLQLKYNPLLALRV